MNDVYKRICVRAQAMVQNNSTSTINANDILPKVKDWVRTRYDRILRAYPWTEIMRSYSLPIISGTRDYALRYDVHDIVKIWDTTHGREVIAQDIQDHVRFDAPLLEIAGNVQTGTPDYYIEIGTKSVSALLSISDQIQVLSTSALDVTPKVIRISGEVSGIQVSESLTLTGTSAVTSTNSYDAGAELFITAGTSDGTLSDLAGVVTVREKTTTTNVLAKIAPEQRVPSYRWIRFSTMPNSNATDEVWYKKKWRPLNNDNDAPIISCANEIIEGVIADALWEDGQVSAAEAQEQKFGKVVTELWYSRRPRNLIKQAVPDRGAQVQTDWTNRYFWG